MPYKTNFTHTFSNIQTFDASTSKEVKVQRWENDAKFCPLK